MEPPSEQVPLLRQAERYWVESRQPLTSLVFIAPLLVIYEVGVLWFGVRPNGADDVMRHLLDSLGFSQHLLLPGLIVGILLGWHYLSCAPWTVSTGALSTMIVESIVLAICVRGIAFFQQAILPLGIIAQIQDAMSRAVSFLGAGIYEELLFRLILLSLLAWIVQRSGLTAQKSMIVAAVLSSLLFSIAHHLGPYGDSFRLSAFLFRFFAGMFFSVVYIYRGFGIAAGSHAAYDIIVGVL